MKDHLRRIIEGASTDLLKACLAREYLQARILQCLQDDGAFIRWAFLGGTALRFLYSLPRYSEDLDFSALKSGEESGFRSALRRVQGALTAEGYAVGVKVNDRKAVVSAFVRFPGLMYEMGLSPHPAQALSIRIEVDTNPPAGAVTETTLVRRHVPLNLHHHDRGSLLAGKLHAVLSRLWTKGRDLYDIIWYLADRSWPPPNLSLLNAALSQTGWAGPQITPDNWRAVLQEKLATVDWGKARADVRPFLEREADAGIVTWENVSGLLGG